MGRTLTSVTIRNIVDVFGLAQGTLEEGQMRMAQVDALVDTGATYLCLPPSVIERLGLLYSHTQAVRTANGTVEQKLFKGADVTIDDRSTEAVVMENDESTPALIGYLILEALDYVVDPRGKQLIPNPEHEGKWMADLY